MGHGKENRSSPVGMKACVHRWQKRPGAEKASTGRYDFTIH